jgi:hypothetical protein
VAGPDQLFADDPATRLDAARALKGRHRRRMTEPVPGWPSHSPGARNAWLLLVTTKPPTWTDALMAWPEAPLTLGEPHPGFLYPDPLGFWAEVRRWAIEVFRPDHPTWSTAEALALTALVHVGDQPDSLRLAQETCRPRTTIFCDEAAWAAAGLDVAVNPLAVPDPHRPAWSTRAGGPRWPTAPWWARRPSTPPCTGSTGPPTSVRGSATLRGLKAVPRRPMI